MYDYNFPESLTAKQLTILLRPLAIPTEIVVLKQIYKKKKELEIEEYHKEVKDISEQNGWIVDGFKSTCIQINALYPNFIMYSMEFDWSEEENIVYTYPLNEFRGSGWPSAPSGIRVINHIFKYWTEWYSDQAKNTLFKIQYNYNNTYEELNEKISHFRRWETLLHDSSDPEMLYNDIIELNEDYGIRVDDLLYIECN